MSRFAHAGAAMLVVSAYGAVFGRKLLERGSPERLLALQLHYLLGILVLLWSLAWLLWRSAESANPRGPQQRPPLQRAAARAVHATLFVFLVVQPSLGIVSKMARSRGIDLPRAWGVIPSLVERNPRLANTVQDLHVLLGTSVCVLIGLHVAAAGWHWYAARRIPAPGHRE